MADFNPHESSYRGLALMARLGETPITICGAGALGANLAEGLARCGAGRLRIIDRDRVEPHNLSTQPYSRAEVGVLKARALSNALFRSLALTVEAHACELTEDNCHKLLRESHLVVDCFDNTVSRQRVDDYCRERGVACLHAGMTADYGEVVWSPQYRVPQAVGPDTCDYPLARNLVQLTATVACEVILEYLSCNERRGFTVTLRDLSVRPLVL